MKTAFSLDCTCALFEWRMAIPACFQKDVVSLAEELEAQVIPLLPIGDLENDPSQVRSMFPRSVEAYSIYLQAVCHSPLSIHTHEQAG